MTAARLNELLSDPYSITAEEVRWMVQSLGGPVFDRPRATPKAKTKTIYRTIYRCAHGLFSERRQKIKAVEMMR